MRAHSRVWVEGESTQFRISRTRAQVVTGQDIYQFEAGCKRCISRT
jgi:hypothetical protein